MIPEPTSSYATRRVRTDHTVNPDCRIIPGEIASRPPRPQERACFPIGFGLGALVGMLMPMLGHVSDSAELDMMLDGEVIIIMKWMMMRPLLTTKIASSSIIIVTWIYSSSSLHRRSAASSIGRVTSRRPPEPSAGAADAWDK